ncbi:hypothetical protein THAOC_21149 [Thalassiosira oceanica]|uniref:Fluoride ion transporter CrcB n=1 Tax=Thalassiosira oceanica TaxID=159749 RepID=K0SJS3_THAOC|nr:hypothetical protein THAOC_21149 [Thalassiosira oceanica]|eukprot:EJK58702.1 hypothetical protein THAOC_21149 [Thalassiosira oceanica]
MQTRQDSVPGSGHPDSPGLRRRTISAEEGASSGDDEENLNPDGAGEDGDPRADDSPRGSAEPLPVPPASPASQDPATVMEFWRTFDTIVILSICSVLGIVFRMLSSTWFRLELGSVFSEDSALSTTLPLNSVSCFLMGLLCSGRDALGIAYGKVLGGSRSGRGLVEVGRGAVRGVVSAGRARINRARGYRRGNRQSSSGTEGVSSPELSAEGGSIELNQRRESESISELLGLDEDYSIVNYHGLEEDEMRAVQIRGLTRRIIDSPSLILFPAKLEASDVMESYNELIPEQSSQFEIGDLNDEETRAVDPSEQQSQTRQTSDSVDSMNDRVSTLHRVGVVDGWNEGTSTDEMKDIILLGLRAGFCGALSTFSSMNASGINLIKSGRIGEALVGYSLSIQLGVVSYRFGQHFALYIFVWRRRRETRRHERRGYGLRLRGSDNGERSPRRMATRRLMERYNSRLPGFPLGTFFCNLLSCALSGSLASFLAGNPGPEERILLTSFISGFAGSLSTFGAFVVEIIKLIDPIIFKADGLVYAFVTVVWAVVIGLIVTQTKNWADEI